MISTLFSSLNTDLDDELKDANNVQPVLLVMEKTMPIFRRIAEVWVEEIDVLEVPIQLLLLLQFIKAIFPQAACSALKHAIVNLRSSFKPMLQDLCYFIVASFQTRCCAPTLEISKTVSVYSTSVVH